MRAKSPDFAESALTTQNTEFYASGGLTLFYALYSFFRRIHPGFDIVSSHMDSGRGEPTNAFLTVPWVSSINETTYTF